MSALGIEVKSRNIRRSALSCEDLPTARQACNENADPESSGECADFSISIFHFNTQPLPLRLEESDPSDQIENKILWQTLER